MLARLRTYASFVRFSHSLFALPFALAGALLASRIVPLTPARVGWIVACMVMARSAAMGFNRLADAGWDARNPRTALRELPRGAMSKREATWFVVVTSVLFVWCAAQLAYHPVGEAQLAAVVEGTTPAMVTTLLLADRFRLDSGAAALLIGWESLARLVRPLPIAFDQAVLVAVLGLAVNLASAAMLWSRHGHGEGHHDHGHDHGHRRAAHYSIIPSRR